VKKVAVLSEEPYHQVAIKLFNLLIGTCSPKCELASNLFWTTISSYHPTTPKSNPVSPFISADERHDQARVRSRVLHKGICKLTAAAAATEF